MKRRSKPPTVLVPTTTRRFNASVTLATMTNAATVSATAETSQSSAPAQTATSAAAAPCATPEAKTPAQFATEEAANIAMTAARTPVSIATGEAANIAMAAARRPASIATGEAASTARIPMIAMSAIIGVMSAMTINAMIGGAMTMTKTTAALRSQRERSLAKDQQRKNLAQENLHRKASQAGETKMNVEKEIIMNVVMKNMIHTSENDNFRLYDH